MGPQASDRTSPVVTRLAPSPTGLLHLGHARSFALAWLHARSRGGRVVLRVEDLDRERCKPQLVDACVRDIAWLGLDWDGEPRVQSHSLEPYERACKDLLSSARAYACTCTRAEIAVLSAPHADDGEQRYPGTCRGRFASPDAARASTGRESGLRLAVEPGPLAVRDELRGECAFDVAAEVGDFLVRRRDNAIAYQLAVVVDDALDGVTDVVRGDDLLPSAARQILLQRALHHSTPRYWHLPLVTDEHGARLSKRRGDIGLSQLRERGVDPRTVLAWVARSAGLERGPRPTAADLLRGFDLRALPRAPAPLSPADLDELVP
ncbi:MAG: tRNA glutamyl-Q(34) synthetase GluQRS [Planctomycetes bacterium]|nr:tRNA glutamyl-Q(34) synthetase GluQRS [Planctomycetota bacterium]